MESSDPAFQALFEAWTADSAEQTWRVRFNDGGIAVFTAMVAHEDEIGMRTALATVVRQVRRCADREWVEHDETWFELSSIKDVTHLETGDIVFPPDAVRSRPVVFRAPSGKTKSRLGAAGVALLGIACLGAGVRDVAIWLARKNWPSAPASVQSLEIRAVYGTHRGRRYFRGYSPEAVYRYSVNGTAYVGTVIDRSGSRLLEQPTVEDARRMVSFKQGDTVQAQYNPANPRDAVLVPDGVDPSIVVFLLIAPVLLIGAFLWWHSTMPQKKGLYPD